MTIKDLLLQFVISLFTLGLVMFSIVNIGSVIDRLVTVEVVILIFLSGGLYASYYEGKSDSTKAKSGS